jgi:hypothetical protein
MQEKLKQYSLELLENSKTLEHVDWEQTRNKKTFDDLKREIECVLQVQECPQPVRSHLHIANSLSVHASPNKYRDRLVERASQTVWNMMDDPESPASQAIQARVSPRPAGSQEVGLQRAHTISPLPKILHIKPRPFPYLHAGP